MISAIDCSAANNYKTTMTLRFSCLRAFAARIVHRFVEENFDQISASLAFTTLLSLVPLVAMVLGIMSLLPSFPGMVDQFNRFVVHSLLPERSAWMIMNYVLEFSQKAANVTVFGLLGLMLSVLLLLLSVERSFNHVWRVEKDRSWLKKFRLYSAVLVLWPLVVSGVLLAVFQAVHSSLDLIDDSVWLRSAAFKIAGLLVAAFFFAGLYFVVPNARVAARDALGAGSFAALGFLLMQKAFGWYLASFPSFALVYGAFATVPIFLLWLYLSWAMVLLGALVAATLPEFGAADRAVR